MKKKRALISVSDKTGVEAFAAGLRRLGYEILTTGGTARSLAAAGIEYTAVSDVTGFPESLDGRVKTLHPKIHGGLLAVRDNPDHIRQLDELGIGAIDVVAVNLYPFSETVQKPGVTLAEAIEQIDIGGPAMVRSAAKNHKHVTVVVDPADYDNVLAALARTEKSGESEAPESSDTSGTPAAASINFALARKAFAHTAAYDAAIARYLTKIECDAAVGATREDKLAALKSGASGSQTFAIDSAGDVFPQTAAFAYVKAQDLRYGENPRQRAAFYKEPSPPPGSLATFKQLHGKELSYNNIGDLDGALSLLREFMAPAAVAVKHANPCGASIAEDICEAFSKARDCDPESIFGGVVALNRAVDARTASLMSEIFLEIIVAPSFDADALAILTRKKNIRLVVVDTYAANKAYYDAAFGKTVAPAEVKRVSGGALIQDADIEILDANDLEFPTKLTPSTDELLELAFAMSVVKHTRSNAIVIARDMASIGVGPGQVSRIMAAKIAIERAGERARGAVAASDAFFPFPDCVEALAKAGVKAIIHPGGSKNDQASVEACDRLGVAMVITGARHFKH